MHRREVAVDEVPALLSEVMRDVDGFTSVCAIGEDENLRDEGVTAASECWGTVDDGGAFSGSVAAC